LPASAEEGHPVEEPMDPTSTDAIAAEAARAAIQAVKASGVVVRVDPGAFQGILERIEAPMVVTATSGVFRTNYQYLVSYKGLIFYSESREPLTLASGIEVVNAEEMYVPE